MNRMKKFMAMLLAVVLVAQSGFASAAEEVTSENPISVVSNVSDDTEQSAEEVEQPEDVEQPENTDDNATDASDEGAVVPETPADASDSQNEPPSGEENPVQPSDDAQGNDAESEATDEDGVIRKILKINRLLRLQKQRILPMKWKIRPMWKVLRMHRV